MDFERLQPHYAKLWATTRVTSGMANEADRVARRALANRERYIAVEEQTGVPWYVVALLHAMECGQDFKKHLHNGDPLSAPTRNVPKNRPSRGGAPFSFEESACDALRLDKLDQVEAWTIEAILYEAEKYNGWGYRIHHPETLTPYLWSGTNHYTTGKYVADGKWDATAVSKQVGAVAILKSMMRQDSDIHIDSGGDTEESVTEEVEPIGGDSYRKAVPERGEPPNKMVNSRTANTAVGIATTGLTGVGTSAADASRAALKQGSFNWTEFALTLMASPVFWASVVVFVGAVYIWIERRRNLRVGR